MVIRTNFVRPKSPELYKDSIEAFRGQSDTWRYYSTALGNLGYIIKRRGSLLLVKQYIEDKPQPIGYK